MRIANLSGRVALVDEAGVVALDVERASNGRFGPDPQGVYDDWADFVAWAADVDRRRSARSAQEQLNGLKRAKPSASLGRVVVFLIR